MDFNIQKGVQNGQSKVVKLSDTAKSFGSGDAEVYATPAMIALMENTAFASVDTILPKGFSTVGISINVKHLKASLPKAVITCKSEVIDVDGKKITFKISAKENNYLIGEAVHIRYIINSQEFMSRLQTEV